MADQQKGLTSKAIDGGLVSILSKLSNLVLGVVSMAVLARILSPLDYGQFGVLLLITLICGLLPYAIGQALVRTQKDVAVHPWALFFVVLATLALLYQAKGVLGSFFGASLALEHYPWLYVLMPSMSVAYYLDAKLGKAHLFRAQAAAEVSSQLIGAYLITYLATFMFKDVRALLVGALAAYLIQIAIQLRHAQVQWGFSRWAPEAGEFGAMGYLAAIQGANYLGRNGDNLIVAKLLGSIELGVYGRAYNLMSKPVVALTGFTNSVFFPLMVAARQQPDAFRSGYHKALAFAAFVGVPLSVYLCVAAEDIIRVVLGASWDEVAIPFAMLAAASYFRLAQRVTETVTLASGHLRGATAQQIFYGFIVMGAAAYGAAWGVNGVATAVAGALGVFFVVSLLHANRVTGSSLAQVARVSMPAILCSLLALAAQLGVRAFAAPETGLVSLLLSGCFWLAYAASWGAIHLAFPDDITLSLIRRLRRRS